MDILGIGYLGLETPNLDAWRDYGTNVLGFQIAPLVEPDADSLHLKMDDRRFRFAFRKGPIDRLTYIGWEAAGRLAFGAAVKKFRAHNIPIEIGDARLCERRAVKELIRFKDPGGYQHELFYGQKWDPRSFVPGRPHGGYLADARGIGHLVVITPKYDDELERFLVEIMGFRWWGSGAGKGKIGFFRSRLNNHTSHDIAYGHRPGYMGIQHIGLYVKSVRDVGETYDIVQKRQLKMQMKLGQHTQDPHLSFYHFSPGGFAIECIAELEPWPGDPFEPNPERLSFWGHDLVGPILGTSVRPLEEFQRAGAEAA
jgi:2,3-dihydroxybiphenyl 1,2-dioxygenase